MQPRASQEDTVMLSSLAWRLFANQHENICQDCSGQLGATGVHWLN